MTGRGREKVGGKKLKLRQQCLLSSTVTSYDLSPQDDFQLRISTPPNPTVTESPPEEYFETWLKAFLKEIY